MAIDGKVKDIIDYISRQSGLGALSEAASNSVFGINHRGIGSPIPQNTDVQGLTFFTRPRMNLSYDNLATDRVFTPLLTANEKSYQRMVRCLLDPDSAWETVPTKSMLVDPFNPFISILSNHLISLSGWPDPSFSFFTSKEGAAKESWSMIDDVARNFGTFPLQATFRNIAGDPITLLFNIWTRYAARVYDGTLMPRPDMIVDNEIDYQTRIYRMILDPSRQYVQKIAACGAAFPTAVSLGAAFNYSSDGPINRETNQQISIPFQCIGVDYNDPILINEFNSLVMYFNPGMREANRRGTMVKLTPGELMFFNFYGMPRIDPVTMELEWWVNRGTYQEIFKYKDLMPTPPISNNPNNTLSNDPKNQQVGFAERLKNQPLLK